MHIFAVSFRGIVQSPRRLFLLYSQRNCSSPKVYNPIKSKHDDYMQYSYLNFASQNKYTEEQTIVHSGNKQVIDSLKSVSLTSNKQFRFLYLCAPKGSGKTHLLNFFQSLFVDETTNKSSSFSIKVFDNIEDHLSNSEDFSRGFVHNFQSMKSLNKGSLIVSSKFQPQNVTNDPHLSSRFLSGEILYLLPPQENELKYILTEMMRLNNLKLNPRMIKQILQHLPASPLSFQGIFDKINNLSLSEGKPAKREIVLRAMEEMINTDNS